MWILGQHFSPALLTRIQATVERDPSLSRRALSRQVCDWLAWRAPNGKLQEMSGRKALLHLERAGVLTLPVSQTGFAFQQPKAPAHAPMPAFATVTGSLAELGAIELVCVSSRYSQASTVWNRLMETFHYLGRGPLCGAQLRYLVRSASHGWLGAVSFSAATRRLHARDAWIGWSDAARHTHLAQVVCQSRFLILPTVQVPNLASHLLSRCTAQVGADWLVRYGYTPVLVETFVDPTRFAGTCYQAANWTYLGETAARPTPYPNGKVSSGAKAIYAYRLCPDWQERLCAEPAQRLGARPRPAHPVDWAEEEFGRVAWYDTRLTRRVVTVARDFFAHPGALIPQACHGSVAKSKGAYRLFANRRVDLHTVLHSHLEATVERLQAHSVVLAVQDTSTLNYTAHQTDDMGPINTTQDQAVGVILHDTMGFSVAGTPLGLLDVQCWARDPAAAGKRAQRHALPIEEKESQKWLLSYRAVAKVQEQCPDTQLVSVGDREADLYELFAEAAQTPGGPRLLIRAERSRQRRVQGQAADPTDTEYLWARLGREAVVGYQEVAVPRKGNRAARTARLEVRFAAVMLQPPHHKALPPVPVWAVSAREVAYGSEMTAPLEWMLVTTVEVATFADACERLTWYARRWGIEVYHRTLKSGCRIEDRQLQTVARLQACLAIDLVVAWRVFWLVQQGRETPHVSCEKFLREDEWQALHAFVKHERPPTTPPSLRQAVRMIASLGGFLGRKSDGEPGTMTMWRGLQRLADIMKGCALHQFLYSARAGP
jgi:hypothetical protein